MISLHVRTNLLVHALLDLADPHPREAVDPADLPKSERAFLRGKQHAILSWLVVNPLTATFTLAASA